MLPTPNIYFSVKYLFSAIAGRTRRRTSCH